MAQESGDPKPEQLPGEATGDKWEEFKKKYRASYPEVDPEGWDRVKSIWSELFPLGSWLKGIFTGWFTDTGDFIDKIAGERSVRLSSWETDKVQTTAMLGMFAGGVWGSAISNNETIRDYKRKHAHFTFMGQYESKRKMTDYMMLMSGRRAIYFGWRTAMMTGGITLVTLSDMAYFNAIRPLDIALLTGGCTAMWRLKGGLRSSAASGLIGFTLGIVYGLSLKAYEKISGTSLDDWRRAQGDEYLFGQLKDVKVRDQNLIDKIHGSTKWHNRDEYLATGDLHQDSEKIFPTSFTGPAEPTGDQQKHGGGS